MENEINLKTGKGILTACGLALVATLVIALIWIILFAAYKATMGA